MAVLTQRLRLPHTTKNLKWIEKELTLQQKQLSPLAQPGCLQAYTMDGTNILLPKAWALENLRKLGIAADNIVDDQWPGAETECPIVVQQLRPHQAEALEAICTQLQSTPFGGGALLCLSCGMGKSVTALAVAANMKLKTMIVTHTAVLAKQWKEAIMQYCPSAVIGQIVQDKYVVDNCTHVIASLQSLAKRSYPLHESGIQLMCVDECHHISAIQMSQAINNAGCRYRLGLSATPTRADGLSKFLYMSIGPVAYARQRPPSNTLRVYCIRLNEGPIKTMTVRGPKASANISGMINLLQKTTLRAQERQQVCVDWLRMAVTKERKILVIGERIQLLKDLEEQAKALTTTGFLIGSTKVADRESAKEAQIIFGTYGVCSEGLDIPSLDTLLFLTPRSGVNCIQQCVGRLLRTGGRFPLVIDIVDNEPTFIGMNQKRIRLYKKMGAKINVYNENKELIQG